MRAPGRAFTIRMCQIWRLLSAHRDTYQYATHASLGLDRRGLLAPYASLPPCRGTSRARLAPTMSGDFSSSNARGRSDLRSPNDAWMSQTHDSPGIRQNRRGMNAASSPFRQNGDSRLAATGRSEFRKQIDGMGWPRATLCIETRATGCSAGRVPGRPRYSARRAKVGFGGKWRQPGGESGRYGCLGMRTSV